MNTLGDLIPTLPLAGSLDLAEVTDVTDPKMPLTVPFTSSLMAKCENVELRSDELGHSSPLTCRMEMVMPFIGLQGVREGGL